MHFISFPVSCGHSAMIETVLILPELTREDDTAAMFVEDFVVHENMTFLVTTNTETIDVSYFLFKPP